MRIRAITDIETGGFSQSRSALVEIAFLLIDDNYEIIDQFTTLVLPYHQRQSAELMEYSPGAEAVHGYSLDTLRKQGMAPVKICEEVDSLLDRFNVTEFIGHNIHKFDRPRLVEFWDRFSNFDASKRFDVTIDTMVAAKQQINAQSYALENLCHGLGIVHEGAHTAGGDCMATLQLAKYLEL